MVAPAALALANGDQHRGEEKRGEWRAGASTQKKSGGAHGGAMT
jgi:hypothetical protein